MKKNKFRVWCEFWINGELHREMESSASWFLLTQTGKLWSYVPLEQPKPILLIGNKEKDGYKKVIPLFYTGLTDKNGEEIYEEDILLINNKNYEPENDLYYEGRVLVEKTEQLGFNLKPLDPVDEWGFDSTSMWHVGEGDTTEIIGNKFENPELSKEIK